jgi:beta-lactamase regulating signal transducer with metallopeptidase domain
LVVAPRAGGFRGSGSSIAAPSPSLQEIVINSVAEFPAAARMRSAGANNPVLFVHSTDWMATVRWVWLAGALGYVGLVIVRTIRVQRRWSAIRLSTDPTVLDLLEDCKREAGVTAPIGLVVSPLVSTLAILGWLRPRILIPVDLASVLSRERLRAVLLHELAHFHYADVPATWLFTLARALHWFNPVAHFACAGWFRFREEAADEAAMRWMREPTGRNYGEVLLQALHPAIGAAPFGALGIGESIRHLEKRLLKIHHYSQKSPRWLSSVAVSLLLVGVTLFPLSRAADSPKPTAPDDAIWAGPNVAVALSASALDAIVGRYDYLSAVLTVTREGDHVFAQLPGQPRYEIWPKSESVFFWKIVEAQVAFIKNDRGEVVKAMHHQGGNTIIAQKLTDIPIAKIVPAVFDAYVGSYKVAGASVTLTVSREADRYFVQLTGQPKLEVLPKSETEFFLKEVNAQLTFVKGADGKANKVINQQAGQKFEFSRDE